MTQRDEALGRTILEASAGMHGAVAKELAEELCKHLDDAGRYRKLRGWMSSNVLEGWREVENMGALCAWQDRGAMNEYLDSLPECKVGLMSGPVHARQGP